MIATLIIGIVLLVLLALFLMSLLAVLGGNFTSVLGLVFYAVLFAVIAFFSLKIVRSTERGIVERLGKFNRVVGAGLAVLIPFVDRLIVINITEQMVDAEKQEIITKDNLNATVDAQVYFKVQNDEESIKKSEYAVNNYYTQIVQLSRTTLRDIIGNLTLREANSMRNKLNSALALELEKQTAAWGIQVVRTELKEIEPPEDVQATMNKVVKAENEKIAALDFATAKETEADGLKRATIKEAEGKKRGQILNAEGEAEAIKTVANAKAEAIRLIHTSAEKYFKGNAVTLKSLETTRDSLQKNSKVVLSGDRSLLELIETLAAEKVGELKEKQTKK